MKRSAVILAALVLAACSKDKPAEGDAGSASPAVSASASAQPAASAAPSGSAAAAAATASYEGKYTATPGTYHLPTDDKEYKGVKQAKDDGTKLVGDGTFTLEVAGGQVSGTIDTGPASPAVITGEVVDGTLNGTVRRKDASDEGLTGTIVGKVSADGVEGTMKLADASAAMVREAKISAKKK